MGFIDFLNFFDTIPRNVILESVAAFPGVASQEVALLDDMLNEDRWLFSSPGPDLWARVAVGAPQGGKLSPLCSVAVLDRFCPTLRSPIQIFRAIRQPCRWHILRQTGHAA